MSSFFTVLVAILAPVLILGTGYSVFIHVICPLFGRNKYIDPFLCGVVAVLLFITATMSLFIPMGILEGKF